MEYVLLRIISDSNYNPFYDAHWGDQQSLSNCLSGREFVGDWIASGTLYSLDSLLPSIYSWVGLIRKDEGYNRRELPKSFSAFPIVALEAIPRKNVNISKGKSVSSVLIFCPGEDNKRASSVLKYLTDYVNRNGEYKVGYAKIETAIECKCGHLTVPTAKACNKCGNVFATNS